jgi:hypothetical protein
MDITTEAIMTGIGAAGGGIGLGWTLRLIYAKITAVDDKLTKHNESTVLAIENLKRDRIEHQETSRELKAALADLTKTVDRLAVVMERSA